MHIESGRIGSSMDEYDIEVWDRDCTEVYWSTLKISTKLLKKKNSYTSQLSTSRVSHMLPSFFLACNDLHHPCCVSLVLMRSTILRTPNLLPFPVVQFQKCMSVTSVVVHTSRCFVKSSYSRVV